MGNAMSNKIKIWMENHGSITLSQCNNMFYSGDRVGYLKSSRKLQDMYKKGLFKRYQKSNLAEVQYYAQDIMKPHNLKLLDLASEFVKNGCEIVNFYKEYHIKTDEGEYIADGVFKIKKNNKLKLFIVEIDFTSPTKDPKIDNLTHMLSLNDIACSILIVKLRCKKISHKLINYITVYDLPWSLNNKLPL